MNSTKSEPLGLRRYATAWFKKRCELFASRFYCQIHLTRACQYSCAHCYFTEIAGSLNQLTFEQIKLVLDRIEHTAAAFRLEPVVDFTGGDPLLHPAFFNIAEYSVSRNIKFGIKANPDLLTEEILDRLATLGMKEVSLSLDGLEPFHDAIRGKGSFERTVHTIGRLKDKGFVVRIQTTVSKFNAGQLAPILEFFLSNNFIIDHWTWSRFWSLNDTNDMLSKKQVISIFNEQLEIYRQLFSRKSFYFRDQQNQLIPRVLVGFKEHLWFPFLLQKGFIDDQVANQIIASDNSVNCTATKHVYIVDYNGLTYRCRKITSSSIGNISTERFEEMLSKPISQKYCKLSDYSVCGSCEYFNGCGGCSAIAQAKRGSVWAGDPDCFIKGAPSSKLGEFERPHRE